LQVLYETATRVCQQLGGQIFLAANRSDLRDLELSLDDNIWSQACGGKRYIVPMEKSKTNDSVWIGKANDSTEIS